MALFYITGVAGSGKSAVCQELNNRGYEAHEADDELSDFYNNKTHKRVAHPKTAKDRTPEWRALHSWKMSTQKLSILKERAHIKSIFVCGVASNESEYLPMFDNIFALWVDKNTLIRRIEQRGGEAFGKNPHEMEILLDWYDNARIYFNKIGAVIIDARQPVTKVAEDILKAI